MTEEEKRLRMLALRREKYKEMTEQPTAKTWAATHKPYSDEVLPVFDGKEQ